MWCWSVILTICYWGSEIKETEIKERKRGYFCFYLTHSRLLCTCYICKIGWIHLFAISTYTCSLLFPWTTCNCCTGLIKILKFNHTALYFNYFRSLRVNFVWHNASTPHCNSVHRMCLYNIHSSIYKYRHTQINKDSCVFFASSCKWIWLPVHSFVHWNKENLQKNAFLCFRLSVCDAFLPFTNF